MACSRFRPDSELWRVNHAHGHPVGISPLLTQALATALTAARITDGDVDPTCGQSLARLGYDRDFAHAQQDTTDLAAPPAPAAGWQTVELDTERRTVRVPDAVMLDLGATAKALAADRAASRITPPSAAACWSTSAATSGWPASRPPWRLAGRDRRRSGQRTPPRPAPSPARRSSIRDGGLATSSTPRPGLAAGRTRLHHIIAPGTGLPADSCWRTVSVAAATCVDAEHGEHGGDPARRARAALAGRAAPAGPPRAP